MPSRQAGTWMHEAKSIKYVQKIGADSRWDRREREREAIRITTARHSRHLIEREGRLGFVGWMSLAREGLRVA